MPFSKPTKNSRKSKERNTTEYLQGNKCFLLAPCRRVTEPVASEPKNNGATKRFLERMEAEGWFTTDYMLETWKRNGEKDGNLDQDHENSISGSESGVIIEKSWN
jgi:hypothetical protein